MNRKLSQKQKNKKNICISVHFQKAAAELQGRGQEGSTGGASARGTERYDSEVGVEAEENLFLIHKPRPSREPTLGTSGGGGGIAHHLAAD